MVSSGVNFGLAGPGQAWQRLKRGEAAQPDGAIGRGWATQLIGTIGCPTGTKGVDLAEEITELKRDRNAVILAHNYQVPELQDIADYVGDSLGLSYQAAKTGAD